MTQKHHEYGPSNYPAWICCPHYEGGEAGDDANIGTAAHELLYRAFTGAIDINDDLAVLEEDKTLVYPVRRAYNGIRALVSDLLMGESADEWMFERKVQSNTSLIPEDPFGTADIIARKGDTVIVVDYKNRFSDRDYTAQLAAYAAFYADEVRDVNNTILAVWYGDSGTYSVSHFSVNDCRLMALESCNNRRSRSDKPCKSSPWCSLCKFNGQCSESTMLAVTIDKAFPQHLSVPADRIADMLTICSTLEKRIEAFRKWAKTYALENGGIVDANGELAYRTTESTRRIIDIGAVFERVKEHVSPTQLIASCKLTQKELKTLLKPFYKNSEIETIIDECSTESKPSISLERVK